MLMILFISTKKNVIINALHAALYLMCMYTKKQKIVHKNYVGTWVGVLKLHWHFFLGVFTADLLLFLSLKH